MKTLILVQDKNNYFFSFVKLQNIDVQECYVGKGFYIKLIKRIPVIAYYSFSKWKYNIKIYDKIILFDSVYSKQLGRYLKKKAHNKVFVYSWNPSIYDNQECLLYEAKKNFMVYSFDRNDCNKMNLKYAPMVYSRDAVDKKPIDIVYDVVFVGKDKGRVDYLYSIYIKLKQQNLKCFFYILGQDNYSYGNDEFVFGMNYLSYKKNIELLKQSRAVLDIQQKGQEGLTLRIVEALFYQKKIITNKSDIDKYDLYSKNNIFILGCEPISGITKFLEKPIDIIPDYILNNYDLKYWIDKIK